MTFFYQKNAKLAIFFETKKLIRKKFIEDSDYIKK